MDIGNQQRVIIVEDPAEIPGTTDVTDVSPSIASDPQVDSVVPRRLN